MRRYLTLLSVPAVALAVVLGGCAPPGDDLVSVGQPIFIGDLGGALGLGVAIGDTSPFAFDTVSLPCGGTPSPVVTYTWTAPANGTYVISTAGSRYATTLGLLNSGGGLLNCNAQAFGTTSSAIIRNMLTGQRFTIVVAGFNGDRGTYQLNITLASTPPLAGGDLDLWLRADAGVSAPGNRIASWLDQSTWGRTATMPTAARQPFFIPNAIHGLPVVRFQGAQSLNLSPWLAPSNFTFFVVGKNNDLSEAFGMILGPGGSSPNNQLRWENGTQVSILGSSNNLQEITATIFNTRVYHTLEISSDGITAQVYRDNDFDANADVETSGEFTLASVGSYYSSFFLKGDLAEVLVYGHRLSEVDRFTVRAYLSAKYGLP